MSVSIYYYLQWHRPIEVWGPPSTRKNFKRRTWAHVCWGKLYVDAAPMHHNLSCYNKSNICLKIKCKFWIGYPEYQRFFLARKSSKESRYFSLSRMTICMSRILYKRCYWRIKKLKATVKEVVNLNWEYYKKESCLLERRSYKWWKYAFKMLFQAKPPKHPCCE